VIENLDEQPDWNVALLTVMGPYTPPLSDPASTNDSFEGAVCPTSLVCYFAGGAPIYPYENDEGYAQIYVTRDGGLSWDPVSIGINLVTSLISLSCPTENTCFAAAGLSDWSGPYNYTYIYATSDGTSPSTTWTDLNDIPQVGSLDAISCPSTTEC
jgi:hypothetical protein